MVECVETRLRFKCLTLPPDGNIVTCIMAGNLKESSTNAAKAQQAWVAGQEKTLHLKIIHQYKCETASVVHREVRQSGGWGGRRTRISQNLFHREYLPHFQD